MQYYEKSLEIVNPTGDLQVKRWTLAGMASVYANSGQYSKALEYQGKSLEIARSVGNLKDESGALLGIGQTCAQTGENEKALTSYKEAF